jgi:hypothetical protein
MQELKSGCPCGVFCALSVPSGYLFHVREENLGSTRKFIQNYLMFTCISNLILAIYTQIMNGLKEPFQDSQKKFLQPTRSRCINSYTCCVWAGGTFFQLCCCVSFWFWREIGDIPTVFQTHVFAKLLEVCLYRDSSLGNRDPYVRILVPTSDPLP